MKKVLKLKKEKNKKWRYLLRYKLKSKSLLKKCLILLIFPVTDSIGKNSKEQPKVYSSFHAFIFPQENNTDF